METFIWPYVNPPLYEPLWLENTFDVVASRNWMDKNWHLSLYIALFYIIFSLLGEQFMKWRAPLKLKNELAAWNLCMAVFSVVGFLRCFPELWHVLKGPNGFHRSICVRDNHNQAAAFWAWAFTWSKVWELGDTFFIIARKKQPQFIHLYHHAISVTVCWCYYSDYEPIARYFGIINFVVHTILYFYLFLKTIGIRINPVFAKWIISIELAQMVVGLGVNCYALSMKMQGIQCARNSRAIGLQMLIYASFVGIYAYLFNTKTSSHHSHNQNKTKAK